MSAVSGKGSDCVLLFTKQGIVAAAIKCNRCNIFWLWDKMSTSTDTHLAVPDEQCVLETAAPAGLTPRCAWGRRGWHFWPAATWLQWEPCVNKGPSNFLNFINLYLSCTQTGHIWTEGQLQSPLQRIHHSIHFNKPITHRFTYELHNITTTKHTWPIQLILEWHLPLSKATIALHIVPKLLLREMSSTKSRLEVRHGRKIFPGSGHVPDPDSVTGIIFLREFIKTPRTGTQTAYYTSIIWKQQKVSTTRRRSTKWWTCFTERKGAIAEEISTPTEV